MVVSWLLLSVQVHGQGTRCQTRADCTGKKIFMSVAVRDTVRIIVHAMIIHKGDTGSGHYYSLIRHPSGSWFNFNDDDISLIKQDDKLL